MLDSLNDRLARLRLPSRRVFAALVLAFLGFGVLRSFLAAQMHTWGPVIRDNDVKME